MTERPRIQFLWNEGTYADRLRELGALVATTEDAFWRNRRPRRSRGASLCVLAEWSPSGRLTSFEGLRFIAELIMGHRSVPGLTLCSFLSRGALLRLIGDKQVGDVVRLPLRFIQLPQAPDELAASAAGAPEPRPTFRAWARYHLDPRPYDRWAHDLASAARQGEVGRQLGRIEAQRRARGLDLGQAFAAAFSSATQSVKSGDKEAISASAAQLVSMLRDMAEPKDSRPAFERDNHTIFVVEDDPSQRRQLRRGLEAHFREVVAFRDGAEALCKLKQRVEDGSPVHGIVADWRLLVDNDSQVMQTLQGFEVLEEAGAYCDGPLVTLTDLPAEVVASIYRAASPNIRGRITWFPKRSISAVGDQDVAAIASYLTKLLWDLDQEELPKTKPWTTHGLNRIYRRLSRSTDWHTSIDACHKQAIKIVDYYSECGMADIAGKFNVRFNPPSGNRTRTEEDLRGRLCARLVVFDLFLRRGYGASLKGILETLRPGDANFKNSLSELGISRDGDAINWKRTPLFSHENRWLRERGLDPAESVFSSDARQALIDVYSDFAQAVAAMLEAGFSEASDLLAQEPNLPTQNVTDEQLQEYGERVVAGFEALAGLIKERAVRVPDQLETSLHDALSDELWDEHPNWKGRLITLHQNLKSAPASSSTSDSRTAKGR